MAAYFRRAHVRELVSFFPLHRTFLVEFAWRSTDAAADPRIDALRAKICVEDQPFLLTYRSRQAIYRQFELNDGTVLDEVEIEYPVGHKRRKAEGTPLLINKFRRYVHRKFLERMFPLMSTRLLAKFLTISTRRTKESTLSEVPVHKFTDLFVKGWYRCHIRAK